MMDMGVAGMGQSNEASTEPRRHPMPNRTDGMASRWASKQSREPTQCYRISPPGVSMRRGGRREAIEWQRH